MEKYTIWTDDEHWIVRREDCAKWFAHALAAIADDEYTNDDAMRYYITNTQYLFQAIDKINDEYIGICYTPMDNWFYISQDIVDEWERGEPI